jgi:hypothetical protein
MRTFPRVEISQNLGKNIPAMHARVLQRQIFDPLYTTDQRSDFTTIVHNVEWRGQGNGLTLKIFYVHYDNIVFSPCTANNFSFMYFQKIINQATHF